MIVFEGRMHCRLLVPGFFIVFGCTIMVIWVMGVGVAGAMYFGVVRSCLFRLRGGSMVVWWVGCGITDVVVCLCLLRVVGGVGVQYLYRMRRDLRVFLAWDVELMDGGGQGRVWSELLNSCTICGAGGSSSPVKVYRRWICDRWCARDCVCRRTGIAPW